jgi:hypothetical protein
VTRGVLNVMPFVVVAALSAASWGAERDRLGQPADLQYVGRLATVEPAGRRVTLLPEGSADLEELMVAADAEIRQGERLLTLEELVIQVGRRVTVQYREFNGRRMVRSIIVDPER